MYLTNDLENIESYMVDFPSKNLEIVLNLGLTENITRFGLLAI